MQEYTIFTDKGLYKFKKKELYVGRKIINKEQSKKNLFSFKNLLDQNNLKFGLMYGTLLGAIREKDFISHDEDVDVFILEEDKNGFLNLLFELRDEGFEVVRYDGKMLSLMRNDDYIDVYIFRPKYLFYRTCGKLIHRSYFFEYKEKIQFLDSEFYTPNRMMDFIISNYGKNWNIPKVNAHATPYTLYFRAKKIAERIFPFIKRFY